MSEETAATTTSTAAGAGPRKRGVVFLAGNFIELDDPAAVTLEDLCEAFGTPWESGMHVKQRSTARVVATLPFEPLPSLAEVSDATVKTEEDVAIGLVPDLADEEVLKGEDGDDGEGEKEPYAVVYDLISASAPEVDETAAALSGPLADNIRGISGIEETMRQLVELGAAELLTAEPASVVQGKHEYNPLDAPGLLRRIVYPAAQYSPYRAERDPLTDGRQALFRTTATVSSPTSGGAAGGAVAAGGGSALGGAYGPVFIGEGGPYTSYLDSYALGERLEIPVLPVTATAASRAAIVVPLANEEQQRIFGA